MPKLLEGAAMKKLILLAALVTALSSAAFAQSTGEQTGVNSALGIAPKTEDFIKEAATSDMLEIDGARIAQQKANAAEKLAKEARQAARYEA
jgi:putative membrane protein